MIETMKKWITGRSRREKILMATAGFIALMYIVYATFFQAQFAEIRLARKTLAGLNSTGRNSETVRGGMKEKSMELEKIKKELIELEQKEKTLSANLTARDYMGSVLKSMEEEARNMPIQLLQLDSKVDIISGQSEYRLAKKNGERSDSVNVSYFKNVIKLKYRSQYPAGVDYFVKLLELPYAVSVLSFETSSSDARRGVSPPITYSMELEVYSR